MTNDLSLADTTRLLNYLNRVGLAINAVHPHKGQNTLGMLDSYSRGISSADARRAAHPMLAALADESAMPFGDYHSTDAALHAMLDANAAAEVEFGFRTFAHLETEYFHLDGTPLATIMAVHPFPIFGLYIIREGDPYRYGDFLQNIFCTPPMADDAPVNEYGQNELEAFWDSGKGSELERTGDGSERIDFTDDMDADPRYSERFAFAARLSDLTFTDELMAALGRVHAFDYETDAKDALRENLASTVTEGAREYFSGNLITPAAALNA